MVINMKYKILISSIVTIVLLSIVATVTKASNKVELQQVDIKTKTQEIEIKTKKADELQKRLQDAHGDLDKLKTIEEENRKLQEEIKALQARKAEKARIAALEQKSLAERAVNAATGTAVASAATGSCAEWMAAAGIPSTQATQTLILKESGCNPSARNPSSGAFGIPQALPASKIAHCGTEPVCQLRWMDSYIKGRYGSWDNALATWYSRCGSPQGCWY